MASVRNCKVILQSPFLSNARGPCGGTCLTDRLISCPHTTFPRRSKSAVRAPARCTLRPRYWLDTRARHN